MSQLNATSSESKTIVAGGTHGASRLWGPLSTLMILGSLVLLWWGQRPMTPYFVDVPRQVQCIIDNTMHIQFPGYVPYHLLAAGLASHTSMLPFNALVLLSALAAVGTVVLTMRTVRELADSRTARLVGAVMGSFTLMQYIAFQGSSYTFDALSAAGIIHYGIRSIRQEDPRHVHRACVFFALGVMIRPLSCIWMLPGLLYLTYRRRPGASPWVISAWTGGVLIALLMITMPFYPSLYAYLASVTQVTAEVQDRPWVSVMTNLFRWTFYPIYVFHAWWLFVLIRCLRAGCMRPEAAFIFALTVAYDFVLLLYIPHAGYLCLLLPAMMVLPFAVTTKSRPLKVWIAVACIAISLAQFFVLRPIPVNQLRDAVVNAYFLQYSRAGVQAEHFDTLTSLVSRTGIGADGPPTD